jgi:hypothetical protein
MLPGVVITPACDLVNRKVETLTYLPIAPVISYLASRSSLHDLIRVTEGQLQFCGANITIKGDAAALIRADDILAARELFSQHSKQASYNAKQAAASLRADAGLETIAHVLAGAEPVSLRKQIRLLLDSSFDQIVRKLIRNSYSGDVHFMPPDEQEAGWSILREPSVALFRYPMTIPLDILDLAGNVTEDSWAVELARLAPMYPCARSLESTRPIKVLRVRANFISDLLTRFTGLYGRIGSPDFAGENVERYVSSLRDTQ